MLDPRLFDLLKALAASDLDWLADEVIRGVLAGEVPLESVEDVVSARSDVNRVSQDKRTYQSAGIHTVEGSPLVGEAQLDWAITHITTRLRDALSMMRASAHRLDGLVERYFPDESEKSPGSARAQIALVIGDELMSEAGVPEIAAAEGGLADLKRALEQWRGTSFIGSDS